MYYKERYFSGEYVASLLPRMRDAAAKSGMATSVTAHDTLVHLADLIGAQFHLDNMHVLSRSGISAAMTADTAAHVVRVVTDLGRTLSDTQRAVVTTVGSLAGRIDSAQAATTQLHLRIDGLAALLARNRLASSPAPKLKVSCDAAAASDSGAVVFNTGTGEDMEAGGASAAAASALSPTTAVPPAGSDETASIAGVTKLLLPGSSMGSLVAVPAHASMPSPVTSLHGLEAAPFFGDYMARGRRLPTLTKQDTARALAICNVFDFIATPAERLQLSRGADGPTGRQALLKRIHDLVCDFIAEAFSSNGHIVPDMLLSHKALKMSGLETRISDLKSKKPPVELDTTSRSACESFRSTRHRSIAAASTEGASMSRERVSAAAAAAASAPAAASALSPVACLPGRVQRTRGGDVPIVSPSGGSLASSSGRGDSDTCTSPASAAPVGTPAAPPDSAATVPAAASSAAHLPGHSRRNIGGRFPATPKAVSEGSRLPGSTASADDPGHGGVTSAPGQELGAIAVDSDAPLAGQKRTSRPWSNGAGGILSWLIPSGS